MSKKRPAGLKRSPKMWSCQPRPLPKPGTYLWYVCRVKDTVAKRWQVREGDLDSICRVYDIFFQNLVSLQNLWARGGTTRQGADLICKCACEPKD
jgi:hypothetical protein